MHISLFHCSFHISGKGADLVKLWRVTQNWSMQNQKSPCFPSNDFWVVPYDIPSKAILTEWPINNFKWGWPLTVDRHSRLVTSVYHIYFSWPSDLLKDSFEMHDSQKKQYLSPLPVKKISQTRILVHVAYNNSANKNPVGEWRGISSS